VRLTKDRETKENKGFAFVTFTDKDAAQRAIEDVQEREYKVVWLIKMSNLLRSMGFLILSCMMRLCWMVFGAGEDFAVLIVSGKAQAICWECAQGAE
jgi:hypothetical protein